MYLPLLLVMWRANTLSSHQPDSRHVSGVQIFLVHVLNARAAQIVNSRLIPRQVLLVFKTRGHIFRGRQNTPDDCLAQGHFRCNMAIEQFLGHVAVIIEVTHIGGGQTQQFCMRQSANSFCVLSPQNSAPIR